MNNLLRIICCPSCGGALSGQGKKAIICGRCKKRYAVTNGVINFLDDRVFEDTHNEHQKNYYDKEYVNDYANTQFEWRNRYIRRLQPFLPTNKKSIILDAACGQGYVSIALAELGYTVIACDLSIEGLFHARAVAKIKKLQNRILFVASDITKLRLKKRSVQMTILLHVIEHLQNDKKVVVQLNEYIKKFGIVIVGVPLAFRYVFPLFIPIYMYSDRKVGHYRHYSLEDIVSLFGKRYAVKAVYYTGHLVKLFGAFLSLLRISMLEKIIEDIDEKQISSKFWASNIMVALQKK
ncbi:MAG: methyltransferase domain-containing protein [Patescibacteria group bacterium]